jgi:hypothetical protein
MRWLFTLAQTHVPLLKTIAITLEMVAERSYALLRDSHAELFTACEQLIQ